MGPHATPGSVGPPVRCALVAALAVAVFLVGVSTADAQWPTTCVEANDAFEAAAGRHQNVGIYQRATGSPQAAEAACRRDHWNDVRATFWWALADYEQSTFGPAPTTPAPAPAPTSAIHPAYRQVHAVAAARGAGQNFAGWIATDVIDRGATDAFLRGQDDGVQYGRWDCQWQSAACPLAPVYVAPPTPRIEASLQPAWDALTRSFVWIMFADAGNTASVQVRWGSFPERADGRYTFAYYNRATHTITMNDEFRGERPESLAAALAHELWHAVSYIPYPRDYSACVVDEVLAFVLQGHTWLSFQLRPATKLERDHFAVMERVLADRGDFDNDVSDWPTLTTYVLDDLNYHHTCTL